MKPSEIILQDSERNGVDGQQLLNGIAAAVKSEQSILLQENDSVLVLSHIQGNPRNFSLHLFTVDAPLTLAKSITSFIKKIRDMEGGQNVYGNTDNQQLLALLKRLGVDVLDSDLEGYTWMAEI
jgi:hypothetical protein